MIFDHIQVMMQLGSDAAGAEVRAKMQSASLLSDMESFKVGQWGKEKWKDQAKKERQ